ncbi:MULTISPECIES: winged helix-turn-helix domain-containing protein [Metallosphaera]|uniref:Transcriptional regulator, ArsR family n=3 Tax=Metallosphaera TaxID=41980 RepID=A4YI58_METS5|nr:MULTISPECIES: winged helix-turn-helix domain-containing protein [Metallosphaera]ABP96110.1 transcriptional regulator, ArsR family [Metallosphaera sedula DSM 5348]AIM28093.1 transcriptional regulator, ArsR family [Metallosphaera sedula]AKV74919.1 transcriptional regulator [Metallosphaera sedula]AKV77157.1 transcriptional regulator [Metallosphaera sedula]AKV79407.1 transcriptional regulator [Metallosphaera sedula]
MGDDRERRQVKKLFIFLFLASRGGNTRIRIVNALLKSPLNANQLSNLLSLDYKTVQHHLDVLMENMIITREGSGYGALYKPSKSFMMYIDVFNELISDIKMPKTTRKQP